MDPKLAILFLLITAVIGLSHFGDAPEDRMDRPSILRRWRVLMPGRRKT